MLKTFFALALTVVLNLAASAHEPDLTHLPLGDGKLSKEPRKSWIWACRTDPDAGGAFKNGPWIKGDTYDFTAKAVVPGSVTWPRKFEMKVEGESRIFTANDYPEHPTGEFPIPADSEAYKYDRNPNKIREQSMRVELPANPKLAAQPVCAPGAVGILLTGSVLFSALDAPGRDAVAHETQDSCQGHPQVTGVYHYHSLSSCAKDLPGKDGHSQLVGFAIDGFGIYGRKGVGGKLLTSADLDECHGHTHEIDWNGKRVKMYHYHATWDFPYTVGCLRGNYEMKNVAVISGPPPSRRGPPNPHRGPPPFGSGPPPDQSLKPPGGPPPLE